MSDSIISISAEGTNLPDWERKFRSALSKHTNLEEITILPPHPPGAFGARRGGSVTVKTAGGASDDKAMKVIAIILSVLSLSVASVQLGLNVNELSAAKPSSVTCTIEGPTGTRTLYIAQAGIVPEDLVRACLGQTGYPRHIKATPHATR